MYQPIILWFLLCIGFRLIVTEEIKSIINNPLLKELKNNVRNNMEE